MAIYTVFETTNLGAVKYAERIFDAVAEVDIENGTFGYMDGLAEGYSHVYKFVAGTKEGEKVVVANAPVWTEDECRRTNQRKDKFIIPAGTPFRVYVIKTTDEFAISAEGFTPDTRETVEVGKFVTIDASTGKLVVGDAATEGAIMNGEIMRKRTAGATLVTEVRNYGYSRVMYTVKVNSLA